MVKPTTKELKALSLEELVESYPTIDPGELISLKMEVMNHDYEAEIIKKSDQNSEKDKDEVLSHQSHKSKQEYMADEDFYLLVELEIKEGTKDVALWAKAKIVALDNQTDSELEYTKLRVAQLKRKYREERIGFKTEKVIEKSIDVGIPVLKWSMIILIVVVAIGTIGAIIQNSTRY